MLNEKNSYNRNDDTGYYDMPLDFGYYYYAIQEEEDPWEDDGVTRTMVYFCPSEYFDVVGYMWDQYTPMEDNLPDDFDQCAEGMYTYAGTLEEARVACEKLGLTFSQEFQDFL